LKYNPDKVCSIVIIIPLLNEEGNISLIYNAIDGVFSTLNNFNYEILFIDDGSKDKTVIEIKKLQNKFTNVSFLSFSRNFGKDIALLAGYKKIPDDIDAVISMDADLQHPAELIPELIQHWQKGYDIVYAYRGNNNSSRFSQLFSRLFYFTMSKFAEVKLENGISDYKLISRRVLNAIKEIKEDAPFFRGLFKWTGFNQMGVQYFTASRVSGKSNYKTKDLIRLAIHSITSFSTKPLTIAIYIGFITSLLSIFYIPYVLYSLYKGVAISGWSSTIATIAFFGGIQLMVLGIIGLYLGKVFMQVKQRPQYIIKESIITGDNLQTTENDRSKSNYFSNI
jgi:polyisoprenyl-phosphate glycosyltransferase